MAHSWREGSPHLAAACAAALAATAFDAFAITLGEARVRSSLGEPLDVRIPVTLDAGESIEPGCFKLRSEAAGDLPRVSSARVSVMRSATGTSLRVQSAGAVTEPALALTLVASCAGQSGEYRRDYAVLVDPPATRASGARAAAPQAAAPPAPSLRAIAATLIARIGDTLESIARAIFPESRSVRNAYIEALRETNPQLATLGNNEPIPVDTPIALPDLRTFAHTQHPRHTQVAKAAPREQAATPRAATRIAAAPAPTTESAQPAAAAERPRRAQRAEVPKPPPAAAAAATRTEKAPPAQTAAATPSASGARAREGPFVLKLSSPEVDLSRSRTIDDRMRAQLRERQMILDQDDQVSALLALRHSVKQLETRVAELQLKLSGMPSAFPPPKAPAPIEPPVVSAPVAAAPKPAASAPAPVPAPVTPSSAPPVASTSTPPPASPPSPPASTTVATKAPESTQAAPATTPSATEAAKTAPPAPAKATPASARPAEVVVRREVTTEEWIRYGLWFLAILLLFVAGALAWRLVARRRAAEGEEPLLEEALPPVLEDDRIVVADEASLAPAQLEARAQVAPDGRRIIDADVHLETRLGDDSDALRRRYIEERFPEITKGAIALDDPDSVVKGARLFYEDGAIARAVELLQLAIERRPSELKAWLALFEIFRLERLTGEFAELARRFREHHGASPYWPKVQYFGREIDPANALYQQPPIDKFETIGPAQAKRMAAETMFDPIAENWLGAPMDFQNEVLANELRKAIMHEAGIAEPDLVPNPMPALRNIEMFTVA